jgi:RNA polymerase sigma factor (sigma-70 family)
MDEAEAFFRDQYPRLLKGIIVLAAGDVDLATEAMGEAMAVACERWDSIENPPAYLYKVAANWLIKQKRKARRTIPMPSGEIGEKLNHATAQPIWEQWPWVMELLEQLPPAQREVMACIVDGLRPAEIAELLGKDPAAVRQNLSAARRRLRKYLAETNGAGITATKHGEEPR